MANKAKVARQTTTLNEQREEWFDLLDSLESLREQIDNSKSLMTFHQRGTINEYLLCVQEELLNARPRGSKKGV